MSRESAKAFYEDIKAKGQENEWYAKNEEDVKAYIANEKLDFTFDEIKEVVKGAVLNQAVSDEELDVAAGGVDYSNCHRNFFDRSCTATVEQGSLCWTDDYCQAFDSRYQCVGPAAGGYPIGEESDS